MTKIADPDPLVRGIDRRIRIHTKISWIRNTEERLVLVLVLLHPMAQVGPLRMCLVPDVVSPHAVFLFLAVLGVLHHCHSVIFIRIFEAVHCLCPLYVTRDQVPCLHNSV
jgi:hypothetical protein